MSDLAIKVEDLGKRYRIGAREKKADSRVQAVLQTISSPFRYLLNSMRNPSENEVIWALRNISFEVHHGEVIGIIGHNGAGKSTLLKILSRITEPTEGHADIYGRVGSLLEVGTGFHPDLTGRENIYMNGTILGMTKAEIDRKFDEIVDFAGVEKFIDTPVKYYSSGMNVRLGFAVAAHLEPEILIVDEVLAVGDAEFQKKSLGKMEDVTNSGRAVLFVSHNMGMIEKLCSKAILLQSGEIYAEGSATTVIETYLQSLSEDLLTGKEVVQSLDQRQRKWWQYGREVRMIDACISGADGQRAVQLKLGEPLVIKLAIKSNANISGADVFARLFSSRGNLVTTVSSVEAGQTYDLKAGESVEITFSFDHLVLSAGRYRVELVIRKMLKALDLVDDAITFDVIESADESAKHFLESTPAQQGVIRVNTTWKVASKSPH
jgi:lipopolysaccharide transport system ATP-binding protein